MTFPPPWRLGERLGALALLLVLLAVLTGVSLTQAGLLDDGADTLDDKTLPAMQRLHDLRRLVDETRGIEALHLLTPEPEARQALARQLQLQRQLVQQQLANHGRRSTAAEDRHRQAAVLEQLGAYWAVQDKVLAASQAAWAEPAQAPLARALLAGESQAAWRALGSALDDWLAQQSRQAAAVAQQSRQQAQWLRWATAALMSALLLGSLAALLLRRRRRTPAANGDGNANASGYGQTSAPSPGLPDTLDRIAMHSRLVALNAAVQAARLGTPSPTDIAERAHLAAEAEALARRCDAARLGLRLGQPRVRSAAQPTGFLPSR